MDFDDEACSILGSWGFFAANISFDPTFSGAKGAGSWAHEWMFFASQV